MNLVSDFLVRLGGADPALLEQAPGEEGRYVSVGLAIAFTGAFATLSGTYAMLTVFAPEHITDLSNVPSGSLLLAGGVGLLWGALIVNFDRLLIMTLALDDKKSIGYWLKALVRIGFAILISLVIAKPLEVRIFQDRIAATLSDANLDKKERDRARTNAINGVDGFEREAAEEQRGLEGVEELLADGTCKSEACNTARAAYLKAANEVNAFKRKEQLEINRKRARQNKIKRRDDYYRTVIVDSVARREINKDLEREVNQLQRRISQLAAVRKERRERLASAKGVLAKAERDYRNRLTSERDTRLAAKTAADSLLSTATARADNDFDKAADAADLSFRANLISQLEALGKLTAWKPGTERADGTVFEADNTMYYINWGIVLLFVFIETAPVLIKILTAEGRYDQLARAQRAVTEFETSAQIHTAALAAEQRGQHEQQLLDQRLHTELSVAQIEAEAERRRAEAAYLEPTPLASVPSHGI